MAIIRAMFIHGVGSQGPDFSNEARDHLRAACAKRGHKLHALQVHWAPYADRVQRKYLSEVSKRGSAGGLGQKLSIKTLSDALMYRHNEELQGSIFGIIDRQIGVFGEPFTIFAHSLGGLIATDFLRAVPSVKNVKLVTFGCNIGLFNLGEPFECPPQLKAPGSWHNFFYPRDILGFPVAIEPSLAHVKDYKMHSPWFRWSNIVGSLSHLDYWSDRFFWRRRIPDALSL